MKTNILLEQIIRAALQENDGATIITELAVLNAEEIKIMDTLHKQLIPSTSIDKITYSTADGTAILVTRRGGRGDDKTFKMSTDDLKKHALYKLNTLGSGLRAKTSTDFVWILNLQDLNLDKRKKPKENRIITTYRLTAFYINISLLSKPISSSTTGFISTIGNGALLFDQSKIKDSEWRYNRKNIPYEEPTQVSGVHTVTQTELQYGDNQSAVKNLFRYFYAKTPASDYVDDYSSVKNSLKFGCELRAACEQFQKEQGLTITGKWDSNSIAQANKLYAEKINKVNPEDTPEALYIFTTPSELQTRISQCESDIKPKVSGKYIEFKPYESRNDAAAAMSAFTEASFLEKSEDPTTWDNKTAYEFQQLLKIILPGAGTDINKFVSVIDFLKIPASQYGTWGDRSKKVLKDLNTYTGKTPLTNWSHELTTALFGITTNEIKTGTNESRIKNSNIYNKLYEQLVPANKDVINQIATTDNPNPTQNNTVVVKTNNTKKDNTVVNKTDKTKTDKEKLLQQSEKISSQARYQWKLIMNAVQFIQAINAVQYSNDANKVEGIRISYPEYVYRVIQKYFSGSDRSKKAAYIDMIIRLVYGDLQYLLKKYPKQVKYFITRNQSTGTTIEYLQGIRPAPLQYKNLNDLLYKKYGKTFKLNLDTSDARATRRVLSTIYKPAFTFIDGVYPSLKESYSAKQVYDRIVFAYDNKIWGEADGKRINQPKFKKKDGNKKNKNK